MTCCQCVEFRLTYCYVVYDTKQMQDCGQPPADILDELAPGLEMGTGK